MTGNFRGNPSSDSAVKEATKTNSPALAFLRSGSKNITRPLTSGTSVERAPMRMAAVSLKKLRRSGCGGGGSESINFDASAGSIEKSVENVNHLSTIYWI